MKTGNIKKKLKMDEDLFGLLSPYKSDITYVKILVSEEDKIISVHLTDNPKNWMYVDKEKYEKYIELKRLEIGTHKLSVKYIKPLHLINIWGEQLNFKIPSNRITVNNKIDEYGYFILETSLKYKKKILLGINKIISLKPQKKYEFIEKYLAEIQE